VHVRTVESIQVDGRRRGDAAVVQMTERDYEMLRWLDKVGFADLQAIRWAMSGTAGRRDGEPVALRRAQRCPDT